MYKKLIRVESCFQVVKFRNVENNSHQVKRCLLPRFNGLFLFGIFAFYRIEILIYIPYSIIHINII